MREETDYFIYGPGIQGNEVMGRILLLGFRCFVKLPRNFMGA